MTPKRILMVANFQRRTKAETFYRTTFHLMHGLVRAGHFVLPFSDRDAAREGSFFGSQKTGARTMIAQLAATAAHLQPDLMLFAHADLIDDDGFGRLRAAAPNARFAQFNVDPTSRAHVMARFGARARRMDVNFITSGALGPATGAMPPGARTHFLPNPVDPAVERGRAFDAPRDRLSRDGAFLGSKAVDRPAQLAQISAGLPASFRWAVHGDVIDEARINGAAFYDYLSDTAMSPALQPDSRIAEQPLYASNRVAQQLGNGVLTFCHASSEIDRLFEDGICLYASMDALVDAMRDAHADDDARRRRAEIGWRLAHERVSAERVGRYLAAVACDESPPAGLEWPTDPIA